MPHMLKVSALKLCPPITVLVRLKAFDSTFHHTVLKDISYELTDTITGHRKTLRALEQ